MVGKVVAQGSEDAYGHLLDLLVCGVALHGGHDKVQAALGDDYGRALRCDPQHLGQQCARLGLNNRFICVLVDANRNHLKPTKEEDFRHVLRRCRYCTKVLAGKVNFLRVFPLLECLEYDQPDLIAHRIVAQRLSVDDGINFARRDTK